MSQIVSTGSSSAPRMRSRRIVERTRGHDQGPVTRLVTPSYLGELLKPFVFLDLFDWRADRSTFTGFGLHPHSGIATVTHLFAGSVRWEDTTGASGDVRAGGVEWFRAGGGAWHGGGPGDDPRTCGFQLWIALPPEQELESAESIYLTADEIETDGPASVLIGAYGKARSPVKAPTSMNYLSVRLKAGQSWRYQPPADHSVLWIALARGRIETSEPVQAGELIAFEPSNAAIDIRAEADAEFVLGSAAGHPYDLVRGRYSVHTSVSSLKRGEWKIADIAEKLRREGRL